MPNTSGIEESIIFEERRLLFIEVNSVSTMKLVFFWTPWTIYTQFCPRHQRRLGNVCVLCR